MASRVLDPRKDRKLQPAHELQAMLRRLPKPFAFTAATVQQARAWQRRTRPALARTLGFQDTPVVPPRPKVIEEVDKGDYVRRKVVIATGPESHLPVYLLVPKAVGPHPTVLAFAGHGGGVKEIVGLTTEGQERDVPDGYQRDFAVAICRAGFAVAAPEIACFGEHVSDFSHLRQEVPDCCNHTARTALHLGGSALGLRVRDGRRLVDWLASRPEFDTRRLGAMGISGGGMHAFYSAALDLRIRAVVVSGYYCHYTHSLLAMDHCNCNFVPGLAKFGDVSDVVGLVAPRPMLIEAGTEDPIFPVAGVRQAVARGRRVYRVFGQGTTIETDYFVGDHRISGRVAYDWLRRQLLG